MTKIDVKPGQRWIETHPRFAADGPQTVEVLAIPGNGPMVRVRHASYGNIRTGTVYEVRYSCFGGCRGYKLLEGA